MGVCVCSPNQTECKCNSVKQQPIAWLEGQTLAWDVTPIMVNARKQENKRIRDLLSSSDLDLTSLTLADLLALIKWPN